MMFPSASISELSPPSSQGCVLQRYWRGCRRILPGPYGTRHAGAKLASL